MPCPHRDYGAPALFEFGRGQDERGLAAERVGVFDEEVYVFVGPLFARLHLVLVGLANEKPVRLKIFPHDIFVNARHNAQQRTAGEAAFKQICPHCAAGRSVQMGDFGIRRPPRFAVRQREGCERGEVWAL